MLTLTQVAILLAKYSVRRWNKSRVLRTLCRLAYQGMGEICVKWHELQKQEPEAPAEEVVREASAADEIENTYPWPYVDEGFANWQENDEVGDALVRDPAKFVVKQCTSYCAWKIRELTGHWPKVRQSGAVYHAKNWEEFLAQNGYVAKVESPEDEPKGRFVGIEPDRGKYGQLYWYERIRHIRRYIVDRGQKFAYRPPVLDCTTYYEGQFARITMDKDYAKRMTWVQVA